MKTTTLMLFLGLAAPSLVADPTMHEKIAEVLAHSDQSPQPPRTAKQMVKLKDAPPEIEAEATVQLPDYEVTAPLIPNKQKVELQLAKNEVARRQEEANLVVTELDKIVGLSRIALARERLKFLDLQETVLLTSLATSEKDQKELMHLLAKDRYPTSH